MACTLTQTHLDHVMLIKTSVLQAIQASSCENGVNIDTEGWLDERDSLSYLLALQ